MTEYDPYYTIITIWNFRAVTETDVRLRIYDKKTKFPKGYDMMGFLDNLYEHLVKKYLFNAEVM